MRFNLEDELEQLYESWLSDYCPEDFSCKDQFIELVENRHLIEVFTDKIKEILEQ